jgi:hypothetical protein
MVYPLRTFIQSDTSGVILSAAKDLLFSSYPDTYQKNAKFWVILPVFEPNPSNPGIEKDNRQNINSAF